MLTFPQDLDIYSSPMMGGSLRKNRVPSYPLPLRKETYNAMSISNTSPKGLAATCRGQGLGFSQIAVQEMRLDALCGLDSCRDWYLGVPRFESQATGPQTTLWVWCFVRGKRRLLKWSQWHDSTGFLVVFILLKSLCLGKMNPIWLLSTSVIHRRWLETEPMRGNDDSASTSNFTRPKF